MSCMDLAFHSDDVIAAAASLVLFDLIAVRNSIVAAAAVFDPRNFAVSDVLNVDVFASSLRFHPEIFKNKAF